MRRTFLLLPLLACHVPSATSTASATPSAKSPALAASLRDAGSELWPPKADSKRRRSELGASRPFPLPPPAMDARRREACAPGATDRRRTPLGTQPAFPPVEEPPWASPRIT